MEKTAKVIPLFKGVELEQVAREEIKRRIAELTLQILLLESEKKQLESRL